MINSTITPPVENRYNRESHRSICLTVSKTLPIFSTEHNLKSTRGAGYSNATKRINQFHRQPTLNHFVVRHVSITCLSINVFKGITPLRFIEFYHSTWALRVNRTVRLDSRTNCSSSSLSRCTLYMIMFVYIHSLSSVRAIVCHCVFFHYVFCARYPNVATSWRVRNVRARTTKSSPRPWRELAFVLSQSACARHQPWLRPSSTLVYWLCCENRPVSICLMLLRTNGRIIATHRLAFGLEPSF